MNDYVDSAGLRTFVFDVAVYRGEQLRGIIWVASKEPSICFSQVGISIVVRIRDGRVTLVDILTNIRQSITV